jgi:hypothetical protein
VKASRESKSRQIVGPMSAMAQVVPLSRGLFSCGLLALTLVSCQRQKAEPPPKAPPDPVIAILNQREIHASDFDGFLRRREIESPDERAQAPRRTLFREFLVDRLLLQEASNAGVDVTDQEVADQFGQPSDKGDGSVAAERADLKNLLRVEKFIRGRIQLTQAVDASQMERYYQDHQAEFVVDDRAHVFEILVATQEQADEIRGKLRPRDFRTFRQLAKQNSKGLTAGQGGDLGIFETGDLPEEFERVIFALKPGQISQVFRSEHGYHIFMVEEFIPRHPLSFKEAEKAIFEKILAQAERRALDKYVAQLVDKASLKILDPTLQFDWRKDNANGD